MYKIIGADGRQYGPVSTEQLRKWLAEGRVNAHTKVLVEGATDWKSLGELPEFATFSSGPSPGAAPPSPGTPGGRVEAEAMAQAILARDYQLRIGSCISRGWDLVFNNFWLTVGATLVMFLISTAASVIPFASLVVGMVFWVSLDWLFLKLVRGQRAEFSDAFAAFGPAFVPLMLFSIVGQLLTGIGFLLCILPGIYLLVAWLLFSGLLIMDKNLEFWPAMELSRKVVSHHWWVAFGLVLVCILLQLLGLVVCIIGFFIAFPVTIAAIVYAYEDIFGLQAQAPGQVAGGGPLAPVPTSTPTPTPTPSPAPSTLSDQPTAAPPAAGTPEAAPSAPAPDAPKT